MSPYDIDALIHEEIQTQRNALVRIEREKEFASKKLEELDALLHCDHERELVDGMRDKCRKCGFTWVRR